MSSTTEICITNEDDILRTFRQIDRDFTCGRIGDVEIIIMNRNNYVNCTKICGDNGLVLTTWFSDEKNEDIMEYVERKTDLLQCDLKIEITRESLKSKFRGIYVHPSLADYIIGWTKSAAIACYVAMMREFIVRKIEDTEMERYYPYLRWKVPEDMETDIAFLEEEVDDLKETKEKQDKEIAHLRNKLSIARSSIKELEHALNNALVIQNPVMRGIVDNNIKPLSPPRRMYERNTSQSLTDVRTRKKNIRVINCKKSDA